jgi:hypothetical protein
MPMNPNHSIRAAIGGAILTIALIVACQSVPLTPPVEITNLQIVQTRTGLDVTFELLDADGQSVAIMSGQGVIRVEDVPPDSELTMPGPLDSTRLLYNASVYIDRTSFSFVEPTEPGRIHERPVCQFGTFPYTRMLRAPGTKFGIVSVAVVPPSSIRVIKAVRKIEWEPMVFEAPVGTSKPKWR